MIQIGNIAQLSDGFLGKESISSLVFSFEEEVEFSRQIFTHNRQVSGKGELKINLVLNRVTWTCLRFSLVM